jgi:hypothetical protein
VNAPITKSWPYPTGLHENVPEAEYHARRLGVVSKGALDLIDRSPAHYHAWVTGEAEDEETDALAFGRAFHCAILQPDVFAATYAVEPAFGDCRLKANKTARDAWREEHAGRQLVSSADWERISGMAAAVRAHPIASKAFVGGQPELTLSWKDETTGLQCKARADYYTRKLGLCADLKSTQDASAEAFRKSVAKFRYHVQDALYRSGFHAVGAPLQHFLLVAVEKAAPYAVAVYQLDDDAVGRGYSASRRNIETMARCLETGVWPGYPTAIQPLDLPPWAA